MDIQLRWGTLWAGIILLVVVGCKPQILGPEPSLGTLYPSPFYAFGDGYTAGFSDGDWHEQSSKGLHEYGQSYAFPKLLANQFASFVELPFDQAIATGIGSGYRSLAAFDETLCEELPAISVFSDTVGSASWQAMAPAALSVHNLGIPHLQASWIDSDSFGRSSPFFHRMANSQQSDYLDLVGEKDVSFFTLWLGMEDLLDYAMTGGANPEYPLPEAAVFADRYAKLLDQLTESRPFPVQGVIGNLPDVTSFPFFQTISQQYITSENCARPGPALFIEIDHQTKEVRPATEADLILLPAREQIGLDNGLPGALGLNDKNPIPDRLVLDQEEIKLLQAATIRYNASLDSLISVKQEQRTPFLAKADIRFLFQRLEQTMIVDGIEMSNQFLTGGVFSTDGIYLTPRGNALLANAFIEAINEFDPFNAQIPPISVTDFPGVAFP
ncbi:MAG: hypothetical protein AAF399_15690 [Bacteroidota bacterium]